MEHEEIAIALKEWAGEALTGLLGPRIPLPPDARIHVVRDRRGQTRSTIAHGSSPERFPYRVYRVMLTFRQDEDPDVVWGAVPRLREAVREDPSLGGRFDVGQVKARGQEIVAADEPTVALPLVVEESD